MAIQPVYLSIGNLFSNDFIFVVPKYQRYYSWGSEEVSDLVTDLKGCYEQVRNDQTDFTHFFGGIVSVSVNVANSNQRRVELIDGQQRLASFALLVSQLRLVCSELAEQLKDSDSTLSDTFSQRASAFRDHYHEYKDFVENQAVVIPRIELSRPDKNFFKDLINGKNPKPTRPSHHLLLDAHKRLGEAVRELIDGASTAAEKGTVVSHIDNVLRRAWVVIHMKCDKSPEAYRLFQVLNDRGLRLTEGELLRARTLEMSDTIDAGTSIQKVEEAWDRILDDQATHIDEALRWIFASRKGRRPGRFSLFDDFLQQFFAPRASLESDDDFAHRIESAVSSIDSDFNLLRRLRAGDWPFDEPKAANWDQDRLRLLVGKLRHTYCMPLLLASASHLEEKQFSEIVQWLERFAFRYKTIVNAHIDKAAAVYFEHAKLIRENKYKALDLRDALRSLLKSSTTDIEFETKIGELKYQSRAGNAALKYLLMTIEHYWSWALGPAVGEPKCEDKSRVFDFSNVTIEHIYPQKADPKDSALDPLLNTLGNLSFLCPGHNNAAGNKPFDQKRALLKGTHLHINESVAANQHWTPATIESHRTRLVTIASKIFRV